MRKPDFLIVGESKCGTTSLYEDLIKHPKIAPTLGNGETVRYEGGQITLSQKELRFFDRHWHKGLEWYYGCFSTDPEIITGEGSPSYLFRSLAMERIGKALPSIKIIIMLRNPVDRLYSHFHHVARLAPKWSVRYPTFERFIDGAHENDYYLIEKGIYINAIKNCYRLFDKSQIHIIKSEDYFTNPKAALDAVLGFLSVPNFQPRNFSYLRKSGFDKPICNETRKLLHAFYKPFNEELYKSINREMDW